MKNSSIYLKAAVLAFLSSLPFILSATYLVLTAKDRNVWDAVGAILLAMYIYALGLPLTYLPYALLPDNVSANNETIHFPVLITNVSFVLQWIIWSQLLVFLRKASSKNYIETGN